MLLKILLMSKLIGIKMLQIYLNMI